MPITQVLNSKANVKKFTNSDVPNLAQQPVISSYYAVSTAAQTVINLSFSVDQSLTDQFWLFVDGKKLRLGASNDYIFTSVGSDNRSSQVTLNQSLAVNLNIQAYQLGLKPEIEFGVDNRFTQLYESQSEGFQGFVKSSTLMTPTVTTGTPAAGTFYSGISNRASIIDLSQDLKARMAIERFMFVGSQTITSEVGPSGELVLGVQNDLFGQIRAVGAGWQNFGSLWGPSGSSAGEGIFTQVVGDYLEVVFYGTGLNLLQYYTSAAQAYNVSVDGGSATLVTASTATYSTIISNRNYNMNSVLNVATGLALGVHTITIALASGSGLSPFGVEILNESGSVKVNPGVGYIQGKKLTSASQSVFTYNSIATGTRGGRVLVYMASDGTIGKAWQAVNASSAVLGAADHTNEDPVRTYSPREFGQGRTDDFSTLGSTGSSRFFTLEDGTTGLVGQNVNFGFTGSIEMLTCGGTSADFVTITFVGTGLDIVRQDNTTTADINYSIDGGAGAALGSVGTANVQRTTKIVSGLPYGTHSVRFTRTSGANNINFRYFIVYQPKKPTLPAGAIELADYNVMADYSANSTATADAIATGVLRKNAFREMVYSGTFTLQGFSASNVGANGVGSLTTGDFLQYQFFGTGFEWRFLSPSLSGVNWQFTLDGATNLTVSNGSFWTGSLTTGNYGQGSFTASTGTYASSGSVGSANGVRVSGLNLGMHTIKITRTAGGSGQVASESFDIITPIHSHRSVSPSVSQDSLPVGSQGILDGRKFSPVKDAISGAKVWAAARGISSSPSTNVAAFVPLPDMNVTIKLVRDANVRIAYNIPVFSSAASGSIDFAVWIDGQPVSSTKRTYANNVSDVAASDSVRVPLSAGAHTVVVMWSYISGTSVASESTYRTMLVEEV